MVEARSAGSAQLDRVSVRRAVLLANMGAGAFGQPFAAGIEQRLAEAFAANGIATDIRLVEGDRLRAAALLACSEVKRGTFDAIIVGGGDGSLRAVSAVVAGTGIPLAILPLGTHNHFVRDLGLPLEIEDAAATIAAGRTELTDLAEVNGEIFINNSSIGVYPYLVIERERERVHHGIAKWLAVVPALVRMLRHFPRRRFKISAKDFVRPYETPCLFVGNNEYDIGLFTFGRRRRLDTGRLWFYVVKPRTPLAFFWMILRLCFGRVEQAQIVDTFALTGAQVDAGARRLTVALDGEIATLETPLRYRSRPGALRVFVPKAPGG